MSRGRDWKAAAAGAAGRWTIGLLMKTVRFEVEYEDERFASRDWDDPVIFSLWHGRLLPLTYFHRGKPVTAIISLSRDGEYIARLVEGWGYETARGSTSRGGRAALKGLVEAARAGRTLAITPDGPRGPRQQLQPGVIAAAQKTGLPIVPLGCGASRAWWPGRWDRFCVPKPFARVRVRYGVPRYVPRDAGPQELEASARALEADMNAMIEELDRDGGPTH